MGVRNISVLNCVGCCNVVFSKENCGKTLHRRQEFYSRAEDDHIVMTIGLKKISVETYTLRAAPYGKLKLLIVNECGRLKDILKMVGRVM